MRPLFVELGLRLLSRIRASFWWSILWFVTDGLRRLFSDNWFLLLARSLMIDLRWQFVLWWSSCWWFGMLFLFVAGFNDLLDSITQCRWWTWVCVWIWFDFFYTADDDFGIVFIWILDTWFCLYRFDTFLNYAFLILITPWYARLWLCCVRFSWFTRH